MHTREILLASDIFMILGFLHVTMDLAYLHHHLFMATFLLNASIIKIGILVEMYEIGFNTVFKHHGLYSSETVEVSSHIS